MPDPDPNPNPNPEQEDEHEQSPEDLTPSALGTKEYWEQLYKSESQNFAADPHDEGQIWFSESDAESRIISYLTSPSSLSSLPPNPSFLDVGTGNGHLLFALLEEGFNNDNDNDSGGGGGEKMVGIDYATGAIELARRIAAERGVAGRVRFEVVDVLKDLDPNFNLNLNTSTSTSTGEEEGGGKGGLGWVPEGGFDVVLDKGTFDAISLSDETRESDGRRVYEGYADSVAAVIKSGGLLVVTSCNWTEEELKRKLVRQDLKYHDRIRYPSFSFGGKTGQTISSVCFRKT